MLIGRYIVLIEDDALMGSSLLQRLELEGAEITWVKQAVRGIAAVRTPRRPVDAVVCDIRLPDGTGEEVFKAVSQSVAPPPFLFITGQGDIEQAVRLLRAGGSDYMTKPFEMPAFLSRLAQILRPESVAGLPPQTAFRPWPGRWTGRSLMRRGMTARCWSAASEGWARRGSPGASTTCPTAAPRPSPSWTLSETAVRG